MYRVHFGHRYKNNGIFVNVAGGTGKSFVLNMLLDSVRSQAKIALAVASSGIAATVLKGGRTAHNIFKIPLMEYNEVRSCSIKKNSELAKLLELTSLIVGFQTNSPVIRGGGKNEELEHCIKSSYMWNDLTKLELTENVRLKKDDTKNILFAQKLLQLGSQSEGPVEFDEDFGVRVKSCQELVDKVYDDIENNHLNASYFEKRAIVSPTNDDVDNINQMIHEKLKEKEVVYNSVDVAVEEGTDIQTSVFNAMTSPSLPPHQLRVKVGSVLMIIRNICPPKLCNGTRIIVTNLKKNVLVGKILGGSYRGEQVMIPRITLEAQDTPVHFKQLFVEATPSPQVEPPAVVASGETSAIAEEEPEFGIREIPKEIYNIAEKFIEEIKDVVKRQSDDEDSTPSPPRKKIKVNDSIVVADEK
ncbi:ATP-dependent DNA helicase Pif1-like [Oratosquilla oratoria]|uniref:ATP-dependent DNA helicase Pif1-like n=1 Tax=Oratosquilla oratoria TaxID=337810 RepID=UPI003F760216